jgi:hypothetical protein
MRRSVLRWYFMISRRATVPGMGGVVEVAFVYCIFRHRSDSCFRGSREFAITHRFENIPWLHTDEVGP